MLRPMLTALLLLALATPSHAQPDGLLPFLARVEEHILNRTGFGPNAWSLARIREVGIPHYLAEQLNPQFIDDSAFEARLTAMPSLSMSYPELRANYCIGCPIGRAGVPRREARQAKILRAIYSRRQLEAVLTDLWFNHFNVSARDGLAQWDVVPYERDVIRAHVFGKFSNMLLATALSPAMLDYLDNRVSFRNGFVQDGVLRGLNENYARELMELHTLGVSSGFTQQDVIEAARVLTGFSTYTNGFRFRSPMHDTGSKFLLGEFFVPSNFGVLEGAQLIYYLARQPETAERVARKLLMRLATDEPTQSEIDRVARVFLETDGDLRETTRAVLMSPHFTNPPYRTRTKRPLHAVASALRAVGSETPEAESFRLEKELRILGEELFEIGPPTGLPEHSDAWASAGTLVARVNAMRFIAYDEDLGTQLDMQPASHPDIVDRLITQIVPGGVAPETRSRLILYMDANSGAPMEERIRDAAALLLASPEFQRY